MKIAYQSLLALGVAACLGMAFSVAQADPEKNNAVQQAAGYNTVAEQAAAETIEQPADAEETESAEQEIADDTAQQQIAEQQEGAPVQEEEAAAQAEEDAEPIEEAPEDDSQQADEQEPAQEETGAASAADMPDYKISLFSHEVHVNGMGLGCTDCHDGIFQQAAGTAKAAGDFTMTAFGEGKYCGACHDGSTAFSVKEPNNCARCHGEQPKSIVFEKPVKAVLFEHSRHTDEFGLGCADCHEGLFKMKLGSSEKEPDFNMEAIYQGKYCGACHDGATAFAADTRCTKCRIGVLGYDRLINPGKNKAEHGKGGH